MRSFAKIGLLLLLASFTGATALSASELVGEEGGDAPAPAPEDQEAPPPAKKKAKKKKAEAAEESSSSGDSLSDDLTFSGGIGAGSGYFSGELTIGYYFNRYMGIDTTYSYFRFDRSDNAGTYFGPEIDFVLRYPNKTILTPFVGAGPGYVKWLREYKGKAFDDSASMTANAFGGLDIRLMRHFGIQIIRKQVNYLQDPPKTFNDRETREAKSSVETNIGFHVSF